MRILITGASGFAGGYLARACAEAGDEVLGISRRGSIPEGCGEGVALDLLDSRSVSAIVAELRPDVVYHLAALSSVGHSWKEPAQTVQDNVATAVGVLEAVRLRAPSARLVWISSCQVYGTPARLPVDEDGPVSPANPYAVSKTTGDLLAGLYADAHGLDIIRVRPFNHAGPGQEPGFVLSSLARQAAEGRIAGAATIRAATGNPDTRRDFTDVRDVVRAYRLLAERGQPGLYNVSSGTSVSTAEQLQLMSDLIAPIRVEHVVDPARVISYEVMDLRGSHDRLTAATGWLPRIPLRQTMLDTIEWWERELRQPPRSAAESAVRH